MNIAKNQFPSIEQVTGKYLSKNNKTVGADVQENEFQAILKSQAAAEKSDNSIKFSKHANERLVNRNIQLTQDQLERLQTGTKQANEKGIQESLVLIDHLAFIVNAKNNTVITAMDQRDTDENIYTNIDGAVII